LIASIPSPPSNGVHVGPLFVHAYGLAYVVAIAAAVVIVTRRWGRQGGDPALVQEVALWGVPAGIVGGRLYFLATSWSEVPSHWWGPFAIWDGGLGIWGGIAGGTLAGLWVLRRRGADIPRFLDAAAPALLVGQAVGRIGNYFNQELFGGPSSLPWALQISPAHRPQGYEQYATFHPTFLYELIWNLALAGALVYLGRHRRIRAPGLFALYVAGYSLGRIGEELLRVDPAPHIFGLRLNFYVAALLFVGGVTWFLFIQLRPSDSRWRHRSSALFAVGAAIVVCGCGRTDRATASQPPIHGSTPGAERRIHVTDPGPRAPAGATTSPGGSPIAMNHRPASPSHSWGSTPAERPGYSGTRDVARRPEGRASIAGRSSSTVISKLRLGAI
jgi:prolipoprotein diacylglyceryl transferase